MDVKYLIFMQPWFIPKIGKSRIILAIQDDQRDLRDREQNPVRCGW